MAEGKEKRGSEFDDFFDERDVKRLRVAYPSDDDEPRDEGVSEEDAAVAVRLLYQIPAEVALRVFEKMRPVDLAKIAGVNKTMRAFVSDTRLWAALLFRDFGVKVPSAAFDDLARKAGALTRTATAEAREIVPDGHPKLVYEMLERAAKEPELVWDSSKSVEFERLGLGGGFKWPYFIQFNNVNPVSPSPTFTVEDVRTGITVYRHTISGNGGEYLGEAIFLVRDDRSIYIVVEVNYPRHLDRSSFLSIHSIDANWKVRSVRRLSVDRKVLGFAICSRYLAYAVGSSFHVYDLETLNFLFSKTIKRSNLEVTDHVVSFDEDGTRGSQTKRIYSVAILYHHLPEVFSAFDVETGDQLGEKTEEMFDLTGRREPLGETDSDGDLMVVGGAAGDVTFVWPTISDEIRPTKTPSLTAWLNPEPQSLPDEAHRVRTYVTDVHILGKRVLTVMDNAVLEIWNAITADRILAIDLKQQWIGPGRKIRPEPRAVHMDAFGTQGAVSLAIVHESKNRTQWLVDVFNLEYQGTLTSAPISAPSAADNPLARVLAEYETSARNALAETRSGPPAMASLVAAAAAQQPGLIDAKDVDFSFATDDPALFGSVRPRRKGDAGKLEMDVRVSVLMTMATADKERRPRFDFWPSTDVSGDVQIVPYDLELRAAPEEVMSKTPFNVALEFDAKLSFALKAPTNQYTNFNVRAFTRVETVTGPFAENGAGDARFKMSDVLAANEGDFLVAPLVLTGANNTAKGLIQITLKSVRSPKPVTIDYHYDEAELDQRVSSYMSECYAQTEAVAPTVDGMRYMLAFVYLNRVGAVPASFFDDIEHTDRSDAFWAAGADIIARRHRYADAADMHAKASKQDMYVALGEIVTMYTGWCVYNYDTADFAGNRFRKRQWTAMSKPVFESYDSISQRNASDCEDSGQWILVSVAELRQRLFHKSRPQAKMLNTLRELSFDYVWAATLAGVTTAAISQDAEMSEALAGFDKSRTFVAGLLREMTHKDAAVSTLMHLFGERHELPFGASSKRATSAENSKQYGGHEYALATPCHVWFARLKAGAPDHELLRMVSEKRRRRGLEAPFLVGEGTGILHPVASDNTEIKSARRIARHAPDVFQHLKTRFYYARARYSFYRWNNMFFTNEFRTTEGDIYPGFMLQYRSLGTRGVRFGDMVDVSCDDVAIVPQPKVGVAFHRAIQYRLRDVEPDFQLQPLTPDKQPKAVGAALADAVVRAGARSATGDGDYADFFVRYDQMTDQLALVLTQIAKAEGAAVDVWDEPITTPDVGGFRVRYTFVKKEKSVSVGVAVDMDVDDDNNNDKEVRDVSLSDDEWEL